MFKISRFSPTKEWTIKDIIEHRPEIPKFWGGDYVAKWGKSLLNMYWYKHLTEKAKNKALAIKPV